MGYHCFSEKRQTARRNHRCIWCGNVVLAGSRYVRENSIYDGRHQNFAWHEACRADALAGWRAGADEEFIAGDAEMPFFSLWQMEAQALAVLDKEPT